MGNRILGLSAILAFFVALPAVALAQQPAAAAPAWDLAITAGSFNGHSTEEPPGPGYTGDWHHTGEWRLTAGRYWTPHFKTEVEFGATGEGDRYTQRLFTVPGTTTTYPAGARDFIGMRQGSAQVAWQFQDNQWVHPYLFAGVSIDEERKRTHVFQQAYYPDPRNPTTRVIVAPEHDEAPVTTYRTGVVIGGGAKWYVSPHAFIKTGVQVGVSRPASSVSFLAGMGFDF